MANLPEELLDLIFYHLQSSLIKREFGTATYSSRGFPVRGTVVDARRKAIASICRANKQCCRLAQKYLFRSVKLSRHDFINVWLIRAFVAKPQLVKEVRELRMERYYNDVPDEDYSPDSPKSEDEPIQPILDLVQTLTCSQAVRNDLGRSLVQGEDEYKVVVLLAMCTRVEVLDVGLMSDFQGSLMERLVHGASTASFGSAPGERPPSRVRHVYFEMTCWEGEDLPGLADFSSILRLPSIEMLTANSLHCSHSSDFGSTCLTLKSLHITNTLDFTGLAILLSTCPKIEQLSVRWMHHYSEEIDWRWLGQVVRDHGKALKALTFDSHRSKCSEDGALIEPIGSLESFSSLRSLIVDKVALFGKTESVHDKHEHSKATPPPLTEFFPGSLEELSILVRTKDRYQDKPGSKEQEQLDRHLSELMTDERFGNLSKIRLERCEAFTRDSELLGWEEDEAICDFKEGRAWRELRRIRQEEDS